MRILFFGDSICAGSNLPGGSEEDAWPYLVPALLGFPVDIVNCSRGGRPTGSIDEFCEALATAGAVDVAVFALGANDARDFSGNCVSNAVANMTVLIGLARESGIPRIVIVGPYNMNASHWNADDQARVYRVKNLVALDEAYAAMCNKQGLEYIPMYGVVPEASMTVDGVHPDPTGNLPIAQRFASMFVAC